jgi:hypothetical protein
MTVHGGHGQDRASDNHGADTQGRLGPVPINPDNGECCD